MSANHQYHPGPNQPTPEQRLLLMNEDDWEIFIEECVHQLKNETMYLQVSRLGGAGDKGRDVCGYTKIPPERDTWDLYQAKHYADPLTPSNFGPELAKFLYNLASGQYSVPRRYFICALKIGPKLFDLIIEPNNLKKWIISDWKNKEKEGKLSNLPAKLDKSIESYIENLDLSIITIKTPADLIDIHRRSPQYWSRFGFLPFREANPDVPKNPDLIEQVYINRLLKVYEEITQSTIDDPEKIPAKIERHFKIQRRLFYSAEGLNRFSRDKLPGAFDNLLDQVELGISSTVSNIHPDGMSRLTKTLEIANTLPVKDNPLSNRLQAGDLQGGCHHLANQDRIDWTDNDD